jgi:hypothetical protein
VAGQEDDGEDGDGADTGFQPNSSPGSGFPPDVIAGDRRSIQTFYLYAGTVGLADDMTWLATQIHLGHLDPGLGWRGSWQHIDQAVAALTQRRLHGKAVLDIDS